jgi:hypothetical protein
MCVASAGRGHTREELGAFEAKIDLTHAGVSSEVGEIGENRKSAFGAVAKTTQRRLSGRGAQLCGIASGEINGCNPSVEHTKIGYVSCVGPMIRCRSNIGISSLFVARATSIQLIGFDRMFSWSSPVPGRAARYRAAEKIADPNGRANESTAAEPWEGTPHGKGEGSARCGNYLGTP